MSESVYSQRVASTIHPVILNGSGRSSTYSLISASCRRSVKISAQVDPQALVLTHIPRCYVLPLDARSTPCKSITLVRERAKGVLAARERDWQVCCRRAGSLTNAGVELGAFGIHQLDELSIHDLVLAG